MGSREATEAGSPLRRLLKPHYYRTSEINASSMQMLYPVEQFAYRTFGFGQEGWGAYFTDVCEGWSYSTFPARMRATGAPPPPPL